MTLIFFRFDNELIKKNVQKKDGDCAILSIYFPRTFTSGSIRFINPCSVLPGPNSTNSVTPSAIILRTDWVHHTGLVSWASRFLRITSGSEEGNAVAFWQTG